MVTRINKGYDETNFLRLTKFNEIRRTWINNIGPLIKDYLKKFNTNKELWDEISIASD